MSQPNISQLHAVAAFIRTERRAEAERDRQARQARSGRRPRFPAVPRRAAGWASRFLIHAALAREAA